MVRGEQKVRGYVSEDAGGEWGKVGRWRARRSRRMARDYLQQSLGKAHVRLRTAQKGPLKDGGETTEE